MTKLRGARSKALARPKTASRVRPKALVRPKMTNLRRVRWSMLWWLLKRLLR
jgi:hypothetical protein